jgi:hypothetical protein
MSDDVLSVIIKHLRDLQVTAKEYFPLFVEGFQRLKNPLSSLLQSKDFYKTM